MQAVLQVTAYAFDVDYVFDHESLKGGSTCDDTHRVTVLACTESEASLIAAQMVGHLGIPTATRLVEITVPIDEQKLETNL